MELKYGRFRVLGAGLLCASMGLVVAMLVVSGDDLSKYRITRFFLAMFGESITVVLLLILAVIVVVCGARLMLLMFGGAVAARATKRGIEVRTVFYSGLLKWSNIEVIRLRPAPMNGKAQMLTFVPKGQFSPLIRFVAWSDNVVIGTALLDGGKDAAERWIAQAYQQASGHSDLPSRAAERKKAGVPGVNGRSRSFGRKT